LAKRATILGDKALLGEADLPYRTVPVASVPLMPITYELVDGRVTKGQESYDVTGGFHDIISSTTAAFKIDGNFTVEFPANLKIIVTGTGTDVNDGAYTVLSSSYDATTKLTTITISGTIKEVLAAVAEGKLGGNIYADVILTPKNNFIIGIQKELTLESKRAPEDQAQYVFYNLKADIAVENPEAAVILINVTHG
ncbi:unnamed protein product, partial [marine sediment metagenome]